jgi:hypothetical protein
VECPDVCSNIILDVSVREVLVRLTFKADEGGVASSNWLQPVVLSQTKIPALPE